MNLELSLEQELKLQIYQREAQHLTKEKLAELLIESIRQGMIKDNAFRSVLKNQSSE